MTDDLVPELRKASNAVYLVLEQPVAIEMARLFAGAANEIERLQKCCEVSARGRVEFQKLCREMLARIEKIP